MADMTRSVCDLLDFSYVPGVNEAFEGNWASGDPLPERAWLLDTFLGLGWLEDDPDKEDVNNNDQMSVGILDK